MSRAQTTRAELLITLEQTMREFSTLSVLFSQTVGERLRMNPSDMECLDFLNLMGPLSAGQLGDLTGLTSGAVTALIDRLERAGYVERERDAHDRRRVIVRRVEEKVRQEIAPAFAGKRQAWLDLCARYSEAELSVILDFLSGCKQMNREQLTQLRGTPTGSGEALKTQPTSARRGTQRWAGFEEGWNLVRSLILGFRMFGRQRSEQPHDSNRGNP